MKKRDSGTDSPSVFLRRLPLSSSQEAQRLSGSSTAQNPFLNFDIFNFLGIACFIPARLVSLR